MRLFLDVVRAIRRRINLGFTGHDPFSDSAMFAERSAFYPMQGAPRITGPYLALVSPTASVRLTNQRRRRAVLSDRSVVG